eukprot:TRINITY_DN775816_c0_g1_i1.p1 TRINITY_DN775816_c0_g1~~TRINITY_DN775816_c0_g1_i1.p1  ORF type:complete len:241 (-),score=76.44 TRINITY_DN775816_c0_g1_i1:206-886(-)
MEVLLVKKLNEDAYLPVRGSPDAAGYDLSSCQDCVIAARGKGLVKTGLSMKIPKNCYGRVAPRSGLAWKKHIDVGAGVIDCDYRGPVGVVLFNHGEEDFAIKKGDRIAQLILERISMADIEEVEELDETERGAGGFGSTKMNHSEVASNGAKRRCVSGGSIQEHLELLDNSFSGLDESDKCYIAPESYKQLKKLVLSNDERIAAVLNVFTKNEKLADVHENLLMLL